MKLLKILKIMKVKYLKHAFIIDSNIDMFDDYIDNYFDKT